MTPHDVEEVQLERLLAAVPAMMAEVERRRREAATPEARLRRAGAVWLPRLAVATAVLLLAALLWPSSQPASGSATAFEAWLVGASDTDPVLDALVR
jgi:hypothetical protein